MVRTVLFLLLTLGLCPALPSQGTPNFELPFFLTERSGFAQEGTPLTLGLPFPEGYLLNPIPLEIEHPGEPVAVEGVPIAFWPDGSVRWLAIDLQAPALAGDERFEGNLRPRQLARLPRGRLDVGETGGVPQWIENGVFRVELSTTDDRLFRVMDADFGNLSAPARMDLESDAAQFSPDSIVSGEWEIERQTAITVSLVRRDTYQNVGGRDVLRLTTRLRVHRGSPKLCLQQSLDVLTGQHRMDEWTIALPFESPGGTTTVALSETDTATATGNTSWHQVDVDHYEKGGVSQVGRLPGVFGLRGTRIGMEDFWQLYPTGFQRVGTEIRLQFARASGEEDVLLEEGFGRTVNVVWWVGSEADALPVTEAVARLSRPLRAHPDPAWFRDSGAVGRIALPDWEESEPFERLLGDSSQLIFDRREIVPEHSYGLQDHGDFFDREHTIGYFGSIQQEYDPAYVLQLQALRTAKPELLDEAMDLVWHYADVDVAYYGGAFQHRATKHHVDSWIATIFGETIRRRYVETSPYYTGTLESALELLRWTQGEQQADDAESELAPELERGATGEEALGRLFSILGHMELLKVLRDLNQEPFDTMADYALAIQQHPISGILGFYDIHTQFADFFALHGGNWSDFPNFHVDVSPMPSQRHQGGHSLIESVVLGYWLTAEPRLHDVAMAFADHHVRWQVPRAIDRIVELRDTTNEMLHTRTIAWPLINLVILAELTQGIDEELDLHNTLLTRAEEATRVIVTIPFARIRSSIHAGITMEALAKLHDLTGDRTAERYLPDLAEYWAVNQYDWNQHAFVYEQFGSTYADSSMTGLCMLGLAYSYGLDPEPAVGDVIFDAWEYLPIPVNYSKAYGMVYRGSLSSMALIQEINKQKK